MNNYFCKYFPDSLRFFNHWWRKAFAPCLLLVFLTPDNRRPYQGPLPIFPAMLPAVKRLFLLLLFSLTVLILGIIFARQQWREADALIGLGGAAVLGCVVALFARRTGKPAKQPID